MEWNVNWIDWMGNEHEDADNASTWEETLTMFLHWIKNPNVKRLEIVAWIGSTGMGTVLTFER